MQCFAYSVNFNNLSLSVIKQHLKLMINRIILLTILSCIVLSSYIPEMFLTTSADFLSKQISVNGAAPINKFIKNFKAPNITIDQTFSLIHVKMNMTNITQEVKINYNSNELNVSGNRSFIIHVQNISVTINALNFSYHIVSDRIGQYGPMQIQLNHINATVSSSFIRNINCPKGIGFGLFVNEIQLDNTQLKINITFKNKDGKELDKRIIPILQKLIISRSPNVVNGQVRDALNEAIHNATCNGMIEQLLPIGSENYIVSLNTTDVPYFADMKYLSVPLDINFQNQKTNATNEEVENQNLVQEHIYQKQANVTATISSNMLDTLVWLIDDSKMLSINITKETLGPDAPISLDTTGLSILMPGLRKYPGKDVIIRINTSSQFSQVFIRSGRILSGFSVSADFIINDTGRVQNLTKCIQKRQCFTAVSLNITVGISTSVRLQKMNLITGLIQALYIHQVKVIDSLIDVKIDNLMKILNPLISSARPPINNVLQQGKELNVTSIDALKKLNVTGFIGQAFLDYASFGVRFDL